MKRFVKTPEEDPCELMANELAKIADAMESLERSGLKREAVVILVSHKTGLPQRDVRLVLDNLQLLRQHWLK